MPARNTLTRSHWQRMLLLGLCLSALLLLSALLVALRAVHQINGITSTFAQQQELARSTITGIETQQHELNSRWTKLARRSDLVRREAILDQLEQNRQQMATTLDAAYQQAEMLHQGVSQAGHGLLKWTVWLFAVCVVLSLLCATWAVRSSAILFRNLEHQASELTRLQFAFLETQENVARRFSHELHDELGQALTAVKANLSALREDANPLRVDDCMALVDRAIADVREMSQLLRPTILDDFGLDAALRSLAQTFGQRTGIAVDYSSGAGDLRFNETAETNLFRIAQEALTNVARHSGATAVKIRLDARSGEAHLEISDNGSGLTAEPRNGRGLGLAGMETRARGCGGRLLIQSNAAKGLRLEVICPLENPAPAHA